MGHLDVVGIPAIVTGVALTSVVLRLYIRSVVLKAIGSDDYGMLTKILRPLC